MNLEMITTILLSMLVSGLTGVLITINYYRRAERRRNKFDTLQRFCANRFDLKSDPFSRALNDIFITFYDSQEVIFCLSKFHEKVTTRQDSENELLLLFKSMCKNLGIKHGQLNDSFFLTPFNTRQNKNI